jgi:hypothetical protein
MLPSDIVTKLNECAKTDFAGMRDGWFRIVSWATALVAFGLVLEAPELVHDLIPICRRMIVWLRRSSTEFPKCETPDWVKVVAFVGWIFIVVGVIGEERGGIKVNNLDTNIQECSDAKVREATIEAGEAATSAKTAHAEADAIKKEADELTTRLDAASRQLADVEQDTLAEGPRWRLLENGEDVFVKALKPFAGQRITIVRCGNEDREQFDFEVALAQVWPKVGWTTGFAPEDQCPVIGWNEIHFVTNAGNFAERWAGSPAEQWARPACGNKDKTAGDALCNVLNRLKIRTVAWEERPTPGGARNAQQVLILGNEAEMALKDPDTIFFLIGHDVPMFANRNKHPNKKTPPK